MAKRESVQKKLQRIRPPRVQLTYDVEVGDAKEVKELPFVVGVRTTKAAYQLAKKYNVPMPITEQLYDVLFADKTPKEAVDILMGRLKKREI